MTVDKNNKSWPVGLTIVFIVFFLYLIGFIILSLMNRTDLVTDNYYEEEIAYQDQIDRMERSKKFSQRISLNHDIQKKIVELQFPSEFDPETIRGSIVFFRPSDAQQDQIHPIELNDKSMQILDVKHLSKGMWRIKIFWQFNDKEYYHEKEFLIN